ncbi:helix-turn-helix transcriptional regulator [Mesorhizobium caraganae]|uniref:helix-turn-helix domain-containing protein n=1 Tax=Mesorhizobium caraganae TaxID=483206 RepID=UPI00177C7C14|nr:XRE family transcriptional regulator [Mesorhizobium caraganae]MBM2712939.1 helix-turn-helix transcriptional regulator [Mesorhizobium caraganae]
MELELKLPTVRSIRDIGPTKNDAARSFGLHMAAMRRSRKMTLDQLAGLTGLNKGYLSRVERGEKTPSIATALKLSQAFAVSVSALFGEAVDESVIHIVRSNARPAPDNSPTETYFEPLSQAAGGIEAFLLFAGRDFGPDGRVDHGGTEIIFVVSGKIEIQFSDRSVLLGTGDFLQFPGHLAHQVRAPDGSGSALIAITREK